MGRRGTTLLWSPSVTGCLVAPMSSKANLVRSTTPGVWPGGNHVGVRGTGRECMCVLVNPQYDLSLFERHLNTYNLQGYRIKPHGQLVLVSYTHYCASTPSLSTFWSRTTLQGGLAPGIPNLQTSFPLRCLQRLSLPYVATRQCHWHDNRYTSGTSTPVLSY